MAVLSPEEEDLDRIQGPLAAGSEEPKGTFSLLDVLHVGWAAFAVTEPRLSGNRSQEGPVEMLRQSFNASKEPALDHPGAPPSSGSL